MIRIENGTFAMVQLYNAAMKTKTDGFGGEKTGRGGTLFTKNSLNIKISLEMGAEKYSKDEGNYDIMRRAAKYVAF